MNMDLFSSLEIRECDYEDEHYSARCVMHKVPDTFLIIIRRSIN